MATRISDLRRSITEDLPATEFVGGFPREQMSVIASPPGTGKTWFILKHAMDLSVGGTVFCGFAQNQKPAKSVIMCGEGGFRMLTERSREITTQSNPDNIAVYTLTDLAELGVEISLDQKEGVDNLTKIIMGEKADICYLDSLIAFRDENENEQQSTSRVIKRLITIARKTNCAIVATHHTRKRKRGDTGALQQDDIIGSSAIIRLCAMAWTMAHEENQAFTTLRCVKTWFQPREEIYWRIVNRPDGTVRFDRATGENITIQKDRAMKYLTQTSVGSVVTIDTLMEYCYVDAMAAQAAMEQFSKEGSGNIIKTETGEGAIVIA